MLHFNLDEIHQDIKHVFSTIYVNFYLWVFFIITQLIYYLFIQQDFRALFGMIFFLLIFALIYSIKIYSSYRGYFYSDEFKSYYKILSGCMIIYGALNLIVDYGIFGGIL